MNRNKKWFAWMALLFIILLAYASYDISTRTSFPGSRPQLKERIRKDYFPADTVETDSSHRKKS
jgi:hypothetical protein